MSPEKVLIIRTGGLGDTLLLWPALSAVRRRFPDARIELLGNRDRCLPLVVPGGADQAHDVEGSGLHHLFDFSGPMPDEVRERFGSYDAVVAFAAPGDYALAENLSACGVEEVHAFLPFPAPGEAVHIADHAKRVLISVDLATDGPDPVLPVTEEERTAGLSRLQQAQVEARPLLGIAPGSGSPRKNWPAKGFAELMQVLRDEGLEPVLIEGPADGGPVEELLGQIRGRKPAVFRNDSPSQLKGILGKCVLFVGNDGGLTHLAALMGIPTVALFGPTDPALWAPRGPAVTVVRSSVPCAPCSPEARQDCQQGECLDRIHISQVLEACRRFL